MRTSDTYPFGIWTDDPLNIWTGDKTIEKPKPKKVDPESLRRYIERQHERRQMWRRKNGWNSE